LNEHVLIVEDDDVYRDLLKIIFQSQGWIVIEAENGHMALERLELGYTPALIVTDLNMPGLDGVALIEALAKKIRFSRTPVVICSSRELTRDEQIKVDDQTIAYLRKHELTPQSLAHEIQQIIISLGIDPHRSNIGQKAIKVS
jgi:CheY-like chemotaxis protein